MVLSNSESIIPVNSKCSHTFEQHATVFLAK